MSGVKRSEVEIEQRRQDQLRRLQAVVERQREVSGLREQLQQSLGQASTGLKDTFRSEVAEIESFLTGVQQPAVDHLTVDSPAAELERTRAILDRLAGQATQLHQRLAAAFGERADRLGRELTERLGEAERRFACHRELLTLWEPTRQIQAWQEELQSSRQQLGEQRYAEVGPALELLTRTVHERSTLARQREELHQKRLYVLRALNKVCKDRGFQRVAEPVLQDEQDRGSPITMTFDTMAKGQIEFTLTLDGIHTESEIAGGTCWQDFDDLSQSLEEMFGVKTHFARPDGSRPADIEARGVGGVQSVTRTRTASQTRRG